MSSAYKVEKEKGHDHDIDHARWIMAVCNVCRYCDGYCDVFRASARRPSLTAHDLTYLAHLCHQCGNCYYACQYAPPHAFAVDVPGTLAVRRHRSTAAYAWPPALKRVFWHSGWSVLAVTLLASGLMLVLALLAASAAGLFRPHTGAGAFYAVVPWEIMVPLTGLALLWSLLVLGLGVVRFWRDSVGSTPGNAPQNAVPHAVAAALRDIVTLRNLSGGGHGCNDRDETFSAHRRRGHHLIFCGFALCLAATGVATFYHHHFGWRAPYPLASLPVLLGTAGGVAMIAGAAVLAWLKATGAAVLQAPGRRAAELAFIALMAWVPASGLLLLALRDTAAMGMLLVLHLGAVLGCFLLLPYGKFAHGAYRSAALLRRAREQPPQAHAGTDSAERADSSLAEAAGLGKTAP